MKTPKLKMLFHLLISIALSFVCIYLAVFFGGWKMIKSGDPILLEIAVSLIVGFIFWIIFELSKFYEGKLKELEERVKTLENQIRLP